MFEHNEGDSVCVDSDEIAYMDRALESWVWWGNDMGSQEPVSWSELLKISKHDNHSTLLDLTEEQYIAIDQAITKRLTPFYQDVIDVEYRAGGSRKQKGQHLGLSESSYRDHLALMQAELYRQLLPDIHEWRTQIL